MATTESKLVPFSSQYLRVGEALPFGLRDAAGNLLLAAGQVIESQERLNHIASQRLTADEHESAEWRRRLGAAMDVMLRQNAALGQIAAARPAQEAEAARRAAEAPLTEQWEDAIASLDSALRDARPDGSWLARVADVQAAARRLLARKTDASLYYLVWSAGQSTQRYCAQHGLLTLAVCELAAPWLGMEEPARDTLCAAALVMNVAMVRLQDTLASSDLPVSPTARAEIDSHAQRGAQMLQVSGAPDALCRIVEHHHAVALPPGLDPGLALAAGLLRRADIFTAKLSRRKLREPMSPVQAARQACLGVDGKPDAVGSALLKALGLYPPGSCVQLASGEQGVVIRRGKSPSHPGVASLVSASGSAMGEPILRDTSDARWQVRSALAVSAVKVRPVHAKVIALL